MLSFFTTAFLRFRTHWFSSLPLHILFVHIPFLRWVSVCVCLCAKYDNSGEHFFNVYWWNQNGNTENYNQYLFVIYWLCEYRTNVVLVLWRPVSVFRSSLALALSWLFCVLVFVFVFIFLSLSLYVPPEKNSKLAPFDDCRRTHTHNYKQRHTNIFGIDVHHQLWSDRIFILIALPYHFYFVVVIFVWLLYFFVFVIRARYKFVISSSSKHWHRNAKSLNVSQTEAKNKWCAIEIIIFSPIDYSIR